MKLHVLSDLHTELADFSPPATDADVVILAGDIGVGFGGIEWASQQFPDAFVVYVPGNHEYYGHDIGLTDELRSSAPANIQVLNNDKLELDGVRFLGCTLWTDFKLYGEGEVWFSERTAQTLVQDFTSIRNGSRTFTPGDSVEHHKTSVAWLVTELENAFDGLTVVVTHHLPASRSIASRYRNHPLNPVFATTWRASSKNTNPACGSTGIRTSLVITRSTVHESCVIQGAIRRSHPQEGFYRDWAWTCEAGH